MFHRARASLSFLSNGILDQKIQLLQKLGFLQQDLLIIVKKASHLLALSETKIQRVVEFLMRDVCLQGPYIAPRPALIMYSLEKRLMPRYSLLNVPKRDCMCSGTTIPPPRWLKRYFCRSLWIIIR
jgi:mTERF domain-containing protein